MLRSRMLKRDRENNYTYTAITAKGFGLAKVKGGTYDEALERLEEALKNNEFYGKWVDGGKKIRKTL